MNNNFLKIPYVILYDKKLDALNKLLLSKIIELDKLSSGCYASNEYLSNIFNIHKDNIGRRLKKLKILGYIFINNKIIKDKNGYHSFRKIIPRKIINDDNVVELTTITSEN